MLRPDASIPSPWDVLKLLRKYPLRWLGPAALVLLAGVAYAVLRHDVWEASQALMVRDEAAAAGPADRLGKFQHIEEMKSSQETILELAKNRNVLEAALRDVGPPADFVGDAWPTSRVIGSLETNLKLTPPKGADFGKTEIFYLKLQDRDRQRACRLADAVCQQVQTRFQSLRDAKAQSLIDELTRTVELAKTDLTEATARLTGVERGVGSDLSELRMLQDTPSGDSQLRRTNIEIENELRQVRAAQQSNQELLKLLQRSQDDTGELLAAPSRLLESQPALKRLKDGLVDAQLRTAQLMGSMSEHHPQVIVAQQAQEEVTRKLHDELATASRGIELDIKLSDDRQDFLQRQLSENAARLTHVAGIRADYTNLVSEVRQRSDILKTAEQELSEARASQAAAHSASLLTRVDKPDGGLDPVGLGRTTIALGSLAAGLLLGVGLLLLSVSPAATGAMEQTPSPAVVGVATPHVESTPLTLKQALQRLTGQSTVWNG